ncbi:MAG: hypothetical protein LRY38_00365 [Aeromonadaceae bacterium]|nr:hypothetical protein [Aeromonadaceae bacterium]
MLALTASYFVGPLALAFGAGASIHLIRQALSMRYQLSPNSLYFSPSLEDKVPLTLPLDEILHIYVIDRAPWRWLNLGTVILMVDPNNDAQPCMKCLPHPARLAESIKAAAESCGARQIGIQILR